MTSAGYPESVYENADEPRETEPLSDVDQMRAVAEYLADMIGQLEEMAHRSHLDLLGYLLSMAKSEAQTSAGVDLAPQRRP